MRRAEARRRPMWRVARARLGTAVGCLLLAGGCARAAVDDVRSVAAQTSPVRTAEQDNVVRVVAVGNSITYGYGIENREKDSYPAQLQALLGPSYEVRNFGHSGTRVMRTSARAYAGLPEYRAALAFEPQVVIIMPGVNNATPADWVHKERFAADLKALIESFRCARDGAPVQIWLGSIMPVSWHRTYEAIAPNVAEVQREVERVAAEEGVPLIDLYTPLVRESRYYPDSLHPTQEGAALFAETVYRALTGVDGKRRQGAR